MSYAPTNDFLSLLRQTPGGVRSVRMPGLDFVVDALARAGLVTLVVGASPPTANQALTAWFKPATSSWASEGILFLWNPVTQEYETATPALWSALVAPVTVLQDVNTVGPVNVQTNATIVRVLNVGAPVTLVMPLSTAKVGSVLICDWANLAGTNAIQINLSGGDVFPNGVTTWTINGDGGSAFFRPVPGGYTL